MLESFNVAMFEPHLGETFHLGADPAEPGAEVILIEAIALGPHRSGAPRTPFSIVFRAPSGTALPQGTYRLAHPAVGEFDLFLVPVGPDGEGMRYEAVFT